MKVFPSLSTRPLYLTGESYSGTYIVRLSLLSDDAWHLHFGGQPYITKTYFGLSSPPVKLTKIAIGDGTIGSSAEFEELPTVANRRFICLVRLLSVFKFLQLTVIKTYPQLIGYDTQVYEYFAEQ